MDLARFANQWFALQVKHGFEHVCACMLRGKGYEEFLPLCTFPDMATGRKVRSRPQPLFPGYLFCRLSGDANGPVVTTPGVIRIVGYGRTPSPICEEEIVAIRSLMESGCGVSSWPYLQTGQSVRLIAGPLCGIEGILLKIKNAHRLVVSISLLQRSAAVEIDTGWIAAPPANVTGVSNQAFKN